LFLFSKALRAFIAMKSAFIGNSLNPRISLKLFDAFNSQTCGPLWLWSVGSFRTQSMSLVWAVCLKIILVHSNGTHRYIHAQFQPNSLKGFWVTGEHGARKVIAEVLLEHSSKGLKRASSSSSSSSSSSITYNITNIPNITQMNHKKNICNVYFLPNIIYKITIDDNRQCS